MLNKECSNYYEGSSFVHKLHPSIKIFGLFCYALLCLLKFDNYLFIANVALVFILMLFSNVPLKLYLKSIWRIKFTLIVIYFVLYRLGMSVFDINVLYFKIIFLIFYFDVLKYTTTRMDLAKGSVNLFHIFNFINYNIRRLVIKICNTLYFFGAFPFVSKKYLNSLDVKGGMYSQSNILVRINLFLDNFKEIVKLTKKTVKERKSYLTKRMYNNKRKVSYKYMYRCKLFDYIFVIMYLGLITFYILKVR